MIAADQYVAVKHVARKMGWEEMSTKHLGLMLFSLFHYYVMRLSDEAD